MTENDVCKTCGGNADSHDMMCHGTGKEEPLELTEEEKQTQDATNNEVNFLCDLLCVGGDDCTPIKCRNWKVIQATYNKLTARLKLGRAK